LWLAVLISGTGAFHLYAQDSDTAEFGDHRQSFTILSQIDDPRERSAFLKAYKARDPSQRYALATTFINAYPQSWLLAEVYDFAARASIDLGTYDRALEEGRFSLRLRPENSTLLVLMANVEAQRGLFDEAESSARDALDYLDQFVRPGDISEGQWKSLKPQLKASAYFALARAYAAQGLGAHPLNLKLLNEALRALNRSIAWNANDLEAVYLRALVELRLAETDRAASDLMWVARSASPLSANAANQLRHLYSLAIFKDLLAHPPKLYIDVKLREDVPEQKPSRAIQAGYAGSTVCQPCHTVEYENWQQTGMAKMLRAYKPQNVIGNFSAGTEYKNSAGETMIRMGNDLRPYFDVADSHGRWERFHVDYTIGSKWQQGYVTRAPDGSLHVLPIEYNVLRKSWINYWKILDPPGSERANIAHFDNLSTATNYQENCAVCHTSQLRANLNAGDPLQNATFREPGVDCEMCHGPSRLHATEMRKRQSSPKAPLEPPVAFWKLDNRDGVRVCAQCHRQSAIRQLGPRQEMNFSAEGSSFIQASWSRPYDVYSHRAFYKDGRFRETTFIVEAFTRSACYRKGAAQCASCHSPHLSNFSSNRTSLKYKDDRDEMCLTCHKSYRGRIAEHTHHPAGSEASRCVSCHMPRIMNALLFRARSHQIEIPRADLTERFGQADSPNACLICHSQKDARWAEQKLERWKD
jgi:predicted CXXCH cytochrome family protein